MPRIEETHEFEAKVEFTSAKSRLVELTLTGERYWVPKKCTYDFNPSDENGNFMFVVNDWWWRRRDTFIPGERYNDE